MPYYDQFLGDHQSSVWCVCVCFFFGTQKNHLTYGKTASYLMGGRRDDVRVGIRSGQKRGIDVVFFLSICDVYIFGHIIIGTYLVC